jgi:starch synthase
VLGRHSHKFSGVLNGIDQHMWSPGDDPLLPPWGHYGPNDTRGKVVCKASLLGELGMPYTDPAEAEGAGSLSGGFCVCFVAVACKVMGF